MDDFQKYCKNRIKYSFFRFIFLLIIGIIVFFLSSKLNLFADKVYALETTTMYRNASFANTGFLYTTSSSISGTIYNGSVNTVYSDASYGITFFLNKGTVPGKVYKIRINFNDYDYLKSNTYNVVEITNGDTCAVVGYNLVNQGGSNNQAKGVDITYTCLSSGAYTGVSIAEYIDGTGYKRITTINWRINNTQWEEVDDNDAEQIIANASINTQNIINNQNQNTEDIIAGQSSNANRIIENQNEIAEQQEKNQQVCETIDKSSIEKDNYYLDIAGYERSSNTYGITSYFKINSQAKLKVLNNGFQYTCYYNTNKTLISCVSNTSYEVGSYITIPDNTEYFRTTIYKADNRPRFQLCKNGNQAITESIDELKDVLTDTNVDTSSLNNAVGWLPPGPVDSIINLPLSLFNALLSALNLSCTPINIPLPYVNKTMSIDCPGNILAQINGWSSWWNTIGLLLAGIILYNYLLNLYHWVDSTLSMRENTMPGYYDDNWGGGA